MFKLEQIDHVALTVSNVQQSITWYRDVLRLERRFEEVWGDRPAVMCAGSTCLALFPPDTDRPLPTPDHNTLAMRHVAFRVDRANFAQAKIDLRQRGIEFEFEDHTVSHSIYLYDPDGHRIEITTYEV